MTRLAAALLGSIVLLSATGGPVRADVFVLATGGQVVGELLNPDEIPRKVYAIQTSAGSQITLDRAQVKQILHPRPEQLEYEQIRPAYPDTIEAQWALAEWCLERRLVEQRKTHLRRIIELDPDHVEARRALGYGQINGQWKTQDEVMTERGYVRYGGRWLTPQEIHLIETRRETDLAEKDWAQKIKRWRNWLDGDRASTGYDSLIAIDDPNAVPALSRNLQDEPSIPVRILYVEILANLATPAAIEALAVGSIEDPSDEVRLDCLDALEKRKDPNVVSFYVAKLRSKDNAVVNLAADGLARMKDPSTVGPLIDALVTVHSYKVGRDNPGAMSAQFPTGGSSGGGGLSMNDTPKVVSVPHKNRSVLDALVAITGQNFDFDQQAWSYWHAAQRKPAQLDARRD